MSVQGSRTPLIPDNDNESVQLPKGSQQAITILISCCGFVASFVFRAIIVTIPQVSIDLESAPSIISLAVSLSVIAGCVGNLCGVAYSTTYGRRPVFITCLVLLCIGSLSSAMSHSTPIFLAACGLEALGASPLFLIGSAMIGDMYRVEQRGTALGIIQAASFLGFVLGTPVGGFVTAYASWRMLQLLNAFFGGLLLISAFFAFPETIRPNPRENSVRSLTLDPLKPLGLLRSPNLLATALFVLPVQFSQNLLLIPLGFTLGKQYNISNPAYLGACFLPNSIGNLIGSPLGGILSDRVVVERTKRRGGIWYPEDRLRVGLLPAGLFVPLSFLVYAVALEYVPGSVGLTICLFCLFVNGVGCNVVVGPASAYIIDILQEQSGEALAASGAFEAFLQSIFISMILPLINTLGAFWTNTIGVCMVWVGYIVLCYIIKYGGRMRAQTDVGSCPIEGAI